MFKKLLYLAIDVDDKAFHLAGITSDGEYEAGLKTKPTAGALISKLNLIKKTYDLKICYEATYIGFSLHRDLVKAGYDSSVINPGSIPIVKGPRVKTDRIDALKMAEFFSKGMLTSIYIQNEEDEALRDLIRSRSSIVEQIKQTKCYILSLCRRLNLNYRQDTNQEQASHWTSIHRKWLEKNINALDSEVNKMNFKLLNDLLRNQENTLKAYETEIDKFASHEKYKKPVEALVCYKGIKNLTALTIIAEIGDIKRFNHPKRLVSYMGLDITEYSSGGKEKKFGITKMGNPRLRTAIVESVQLKRPVVGRMLAIRRQGKESKYIEVADRCMMRLHKKSTNLAYKGKHTNKIKIACAREAVGFIWESLRKAN